MPWLEYQCEDCSGVLKANSGEGRRVQRVTIAQTLRGNNGYLYYASANYAWYDPKTFKQPKIDLGMVHSGH